MDKMPNMTLSPKLLILVIAAGMATLFAGQINEFLYEIKHKKEAVTQMGTTPAQAPPNNQQVQIASLTGLDLFGIESQEKDVPETLPETTLQLTLKGAFTAKDNAYASALIQSGANKAKHYQVGEQLPGNAKLHAVYTDHVVLARGGNFETLTFPKAKEFQQNQRQRQATTLASPSQNYQSTSPSSTLEIRDRLRELRRKRLEQQSR